MCVCTHMYACVDVFVLKVPRYYGYSTNCPNKNHSVFSRKLIYIVFIPLILNLKVKMLFSYSLWWPWSSTIVLLMIASDKAIRVCPTLTGAPFVTGWRNCQEWRLQNRARWKNIRLICSILIRMGLWLRVLVWLTGHGISPVSGLLDFLFQLLLTAFS